MAASIEDGSNGNEQQSSRDQISGQNAPGSGHNNDVEWNNEKEQPQRVGLRVRVKHFTWGN